MIGLGAAAGIAKSVGFDPFSAAEDLFGGGSSCGKKDMKKRNRIQKAISKLLSSSERRSLVSGTNSDISATAREMANFYVGGVNKWGGDCLHKNVGSGDQRFLDQLESTLKRKKAQAESASKQQQKANETQKGGSSIAGGTSVAGGLLTTKNLIIAAVAGILISVLQMN